MKEKYNDLMEVLGDKVPTAPTLATEMQVKETGNDNAPAKVVDKLMTEGGDAVKKTSMVEVAYDYLCSVYDFIEVDEQLYVYIEEHGYWRFLDESNNNRALRRLLDPNFRVKISKFGLSDVHECMVSRATHFTSDIFEKSSFEYINFKDCALNWRTGETIKNRKKLYFRYSLSIDLPTKESTGKFEKFITNVFQGDNDTKREFSKFVGLALSDIRTLKSAFYLYGPSNTGKSVMLNLLRYLVGEEHCSAVSFSMMSNEFSIANLYGKRLNLSGEVSGATTNRLDIFKSLTGNDLLIANRKGISYLGFQPRCLLVFGANTLPQISNPSEFESFISRIMVFPFLNIVPRAKWDQDLLDKLKADSSGVIDFAIKGLKRLKEDNYKIKETQTMSNIKAEYSGYSDSFSLFMKRYIVESKCDQISSEDITRAYKQFCKINDYPELASNQYMMALQRRFYTKKVFMQNPVSDKPQRGYKHIAFSKHIGELIKDSDQFEKSIEEAIFNN